MSKAASEILNKAGDLVEAGWVQHASATIDGCHVPWVSVKRLMRTGTRKKICFCATGAMQAATALIGASAQTLGEALHRFAQFHPAIAGASSIAGWNDHIDRTQAEVVRAFRETAENDPNG